MSETKSKKTKSKMKINPKKFARFILIIIILIICIIIIKNVKNNNKNYDNYSVIIDNQNVSANLKDDVIIQNNVFYMSLDDSKNCFDKNIYYEQDTNTIITSGDKKLIAMKLDNREATINGSDVELNGPPFKNENGIIYIPISELQSVYDFEYTYIPNTKNIIIDYYYKKLEKANTTKNISVKQNEDLSGNTVSKVKKGDTVVFISENNNIAKIRTQDGFLGYVKKNYLNNFVTERQDMLEDNTENSDSVYEADISKKDLSKYENRIKVINDVLKKAVEKQDKHIKFIYENEENEGYTRFKIEAPPVFKECGISVEF